MMKTACKYIALVIVFINIVAILNPLINHFWDHLLCLLFGW